MTSILISCEKSSKVFAVDIRVNFVLGFKTQDMQNRDLAMFYGPQTDMEIMAAMLVRAKSRNYTSNSLNMLYDRFGRAHRMLLSTSASDQNAPLADCDKCLLTLQYVPAITRPISSTAMNMTLEDSAWVLLSAPWPYDVERLSHRFTQLLGYQDVDLVGQNLHAINPPNHMFSGWRSLLRSAAMGQPARDVLLARSRAGRDVLVDVSCIPVIDPGDGGGTASFRGIVAMFEDFHALTPPPYTPLTMPRNDAAAGCVHHTRDGAATTIAAQQFELETHCISGGGFGSDGPRPLTLMPAPTSGSEVGASSVLLQPTSVPLFLPASVSHTTHRSGCHAEWFSGTAGWAAAVEGGLAGEGSYGRAGGLRFAPELAGDDEEGRRRAARMDQRYLRRVRRQLEAAGRPGRAGAAAPIASAEPSEATAAARCERSSAGGTGAESGAPAAAAAGPDP